MGSGKTSWAIRFMNENAGGRFLYVAPFLSETERIRDACPALQFALPAEGRKQVELRRLLLAGRNVAISHELLRQFQLTDEDAEIVYDYGYTMILDEAVDTILPVQDMNATDYAKVISELEVSEDGTCRWVGTEMPPKRYLDLKDTADRGNLLCCRKSFFWNMPMRLFSVCDVWVLTFMFEASHLAHSFRLRGWQWETGYIRAGKFIPGTEPLDEEKRRLRSLIEIESGKVNEIGAARGSLSATWYKQRATQDELRTLFNRARNF